MGNCVQILLDVFLNIPLAESIGVIFLIIGKTCQPFGSCEQRFRKTVDNHCALRINSVRFIPLNGGFVHAYTPAKFRHGNV